LPVSIEAFERSGPEGPTLTIAGAAIDEDGHFWTTLWDSDHDVYPTSCNLARWEADEIVEIVPVMETGLVDFDKLFVMFDGRFAFTYIDGGYQDSIVMQTVEGDFVKGESPAQFMVPGPDGDFHRPGLFPRGFLIDRYGNPTDGFTSRQPRHTLARNLKRLRAFFFSKSASGT